MRKASHFYNRPLRYIYEKMGTNENKNRHGNSKSERELKWGNTTASKKSSIRGIRGKYGGLMQECSKQTKWYLKVL